MREVLLQARDAELDKITYEMELMEFDKDDNRITIDDLTPSQLERFRELQHLKNENREIGRKSICMCYNCGKPDKDMFYNYPYRPWFCVECVKFLKKGHAKMKVKKATVNTLAIPTTISVRAFSKFLKIFSLILIFFIFSQKNFYFSKIPEK